MPDEVNTRLAVALIAEGLSEMSVLAKRGYFSDFQTPLATPKIVLNDMLMILGHRDLAKRVREGEFDG